MVDGLKTFYLDAGIGPVVFCIHGVPTSSFLYRKVVQQLQLRGLRAIAIDLPGLFIIMVTNWECQMFVLIILMITGMFKR